MSSETLQLSKNNVKNSGTDISRINSLRNESPDSKYNLKPYDRVIESKLNLDKYSSFPNLLN